MPPVLQTLENRRFHTQPLKAIPVLRRGLSNQTLIKWLKSVAIFGPKRLKKKKTYPLARYILKYTACVLVDLSIIVSYFICSEPPVNYSNCCGGPVRIFFFFLFFCYLAFTVLLSLTKPVKLTKCNTRK